jgi:hypothetical protein
MPSSYTVPAWLTVLEFARIAIIEPSELFEPKLQAFLIRNEWPWMVDGRVALHPLAVQPGAKYHVSDLIRFYLTLESMQEDYEWLNALPTSS